jgi:type I restriction enzyme S subunit
VTEHKEHALPDCWAWTKLGDIAEITLGQSPPSSDYNENGKGLPFYQGKTEFGKTYPTPKKWCNKPKKIAQKGDVLISVRAPVGPTNLSNEKSCIGRGLASIRGLCGIDSYYILHLLRRYEKEIAAKGTGTTFSAISGNQLRNLEIPLPPLNEQRRIINKVEVLFSYLDAGIASLRLVQAQLKRYRQAVLKAAFEGKLTQQWRIENIGKIDSAEKLLVQIKRERINNPEYKELPSVNPIELPEIPASWSWTRLGEILFLSSERYNPNPSENLPFVGLENIEGGTGKLLGFGKSSETKGTKNRSN